MERKVNKNLNLQSDAEEKAFNARPHITRKEFKALKLPAFVRVKYIDGPDDVELICDRHLEETFARDEQGRLQPGMIDEYTQIVEVLDTVEWPELSK